MEHLKAHNIPVALATSSSRDFFERKMSGPNTASLRHHFHVGPVHLTDQSDPGHKAKLAESVNITGRMKALCQHAEPNLVCRRGN